ncbi:MAG: NRDE family protein [Gemmatimonadota bacterium]|nr:NRDE family protein [Gemmatimonadota bacterium]
MCLILVAHEHHPRYRLVVAANRDEFYARPTAPAHFWTDAPNVLGGRDLRAGGSWLGLTRGGRFAAVTNYRETKPPPVNARSRGELVGDYLRGGAPPDDYLREVESRGDVYAGFNLLVGDRETLWFFSNRHSEIRRLEPGIHGLSNGAFDASWEKVERGMRALRPALAGDGLEVDDLFRILSDRRTAGAADLPDTGMARDQELLLSAPFIESADYGTRASTVIWIGRDGSGAFIELSVAPGGDRREERFDLVVSDR